MFSKNKPVKTTYGIVGLGRFGSALATKLAEFGAELMVIDRDEERVREMRDYTDNAFVVPNIDKKSLAETGIQNCDVGVVCIGDQLDISILTTLNLVGMGIKKVVAKAMSEEHGEVLKKLGAEVVYPEQDMAIRLAVRLENSNVLDFMQLTEKVNISKLFVPEWAVGKSVVETEFRSKFALNIIVIENAGNVVEHVKPDYVFKKGDILFVSGSKDAVIRLSERAEEN